MLEIADGDAVARQLVAARGDVEVIAASDAFSVGTRRPRHRLDGLFDLAGQLLDLAQILAEHLDADRRADAGRQHVDTRLDRHGPRVGHTGELERRIHFGNQLVHRHAGPPFLFRLEVDHGFEHFHRCRVGRRGRTAGLAIDRLNFGEGLDDPVGGLQQARGFSHRHAGQRGGHIEQRALVQGRHEFGTDLAGRNDRHRHRHQCQDQRQDLVAHYPLDDWPVGPDQEAIHRIFLLRHDAPANEEHHQDRHQRHRQQGGAGHRKGLGEGERTEQTAFLAFEREHRQERNGDDQQREEQRRADFLAGLDHGCPALRLGGVGWEVL